MTPLKARFGPGCVLTGEGRRACDGVVVEMVLSGSGKEQRVEKLRLLEVHDINIAERHVEREVAWFLRRCAALIQQEGLTIIGQEEQIFYVPPERIEIGKIRFQ